eukprot:12289627-Heterocapsa_arctica.AAC.1
MTVAAAIVRGLWAGSSGALAVHWTCLGCNGLNQAVRSRCAYCRNEKPEAKLPLVRFAYDEEGVFESAVSAVTKTNGSDGGVLAL